MKNSGDPGQVILREWRVLEVVSRDRVRSRHIRGHDIGNDQGRASTSIMAFDAATMTATTRSGRRYILEGPPGDSRLGKAAWERWSNDHGVLAESDVTEEYLQANRRQADTTITFTKLNRAMHLDDTQ